MTDLSSIDSGLIDISSRVSGLGGYNKSTYSVFSGLNPIGGMPALPHNTDNQGFVFFTKPCLNLSYNNVIGIRKLAFLADNRANSMGNLIRCMLSPKPILTRTTAESDKDRSSIIDDDSAFMPISVLLNSLSKPPDTVPDVYTSNEGYNKQQVAWIDSKPLNYTKYDITAEFANMEGDPISTIFSTWIEYMTRMVDGSMRPYPINIAENRIDSMTRIYQFTMDRSMTFVQKIWATGAAFPSSNPDGAAFGFTRGRHLNTDNNEIQITFTCLGAQYNDPILIKEFNSTVALFNSNMAPDINGNITSVMTKVNTIINGINLKMLMRDKLYPRVNPITMELEWYANTDDYNNMVAMVNTLTPTPTQPAGTYTNSQGIVPWITPWTNTVLPPKNNQ